MGLCSRLAFDEFMRALVAVQAEIRLRTAAGRISMVESASVANWGFCNGPLIPVYSAATAWT
jgi:hypothetical protein